MPLRLAPPSPSSSNEPVRPRGGTFGKQKISSVVPGTTIDLSGPVNLSSSSKQLSFKGTPNKFVSTRIGSGQNSLRRITTRGGQVVTVSRDSSGRFKS